MSAVLLLMLANCYGQNFDQEPRDKAGGYFGLSAGLTTGVGFSFRSWGQKTGVQFTILPGAGR